MVIIFIKLIFIINNINICYKHKLTMKTYKLYSVFTKNFNFLFFFEIRNGFNIFLYFLKILFIFILIFLSFFFKLKMAWSLY